VKEKRTYRRFNLVAFLAILGCAGMLLFEGIFIFELYDRAVEQPEAPVPVIAAPAAMPAPARRELIEPARGEPVEPVEAPVAPAAPAEVPPAEIETAPAAAPVG
jgi:hypothetical protein